MPKFSTSVVLFFGTVSSVITIVIIAIHYSHPFENVLLTQQLEIVLWTSLGTAVAYSVILLVSGRTEKCPSCGKWWARMIQSKEELGREFEFVNSDFISFDERQVRMSGLPDRPRRVVTDSYKIHCLCRYCSHEWTTVSTKEYST